MLSASKITRTAVHALAAVAIATTAAVPTVPATAQTLQSEGGLHRTVYVPRDKSLSFRLSQPASRIVVANPEIAKVTATTGSSFYVQGIEFGSTNLLVYGPGGELLEVIDVRVGYDAEALQQDLRGAFPNEAIRVRNLGEMLMLAGEVSTTGVQSGAERMAEKYAPDSIISRMTVRASEQVILEVRILEASRTALQDVGVNFNVFNSSWGWASGAGLIGVTPAASDIVTHGRAGPVNIDTELQLLEQKGVVRTLAKPNLVAISGQKASFLAGGEFPFPVPQGQNQVTIEFRPYGVKLNFIPQVQDNGWIRLAVEPEVSQLDQNNALTVNGVSVPALTVRRANTTLELKPGDTFAMAGLFQHDYTNSVSQTPWLGDLPVLGALFRSARWKRSESELLILVTPRMATPADHTVSPIDSMPGKEPSAAALFLMGKSHDKPLPRDKGPEAAPPAQAAK